MEELREIALDVDEEEEAEEEEEEEEEEGEMTREEDSGSCSERVAEGDSSDSEEAQPSDG